jgi:WD40 repeat protein
MIAAIEQGDGFVAVWDAQDGRLLYQGPSDPPPLNNSILFSPDSSRLIVSHFDTGIIEALSTETWTPVASVQLDTAVFGTRLPTPFGFIDDGATMVAMGGDFGAPGASLFWFDAGTLELRQTVEHAHTGNPAAGSVSPDGSRMATSASDGSVRIWATGTGTLLQQMTLGTQAQGVAFIDDRHIAVTPGDGGLLVMTIDQSELQTLVRRSLTRGFTATECATYAIDPCPTLTQMRGA